MELGHRVPLPTRGTSFRLRICCMSPADPPPPLPSGSIPSPSTTRSGAEPRNSANTASPSAGPLLPPTPTALLNNRFLIQSQGAAGGGAGLQLSPPLVPRSIEDTLPGVLRPLAVKSLLLRLCALGSALGFVSSLRQVPEIAQPVKALTSKREGFQFHP